MRSRSRDTPELVYLVLCGVVWICGSKEKKSTDHRSVARLRDMRTEGKETVAVRTDNG